MTLDLRTAALWTCFLLAFAGLSVCSSVQERNEVGLAIGATVTPSQSLRNNAGQPAGTSFAFDPSFAFVADFYHALKMSRSAAIYVGISLAASPLDVITNRGPSTGIKEYAYLFVTPEIRVKFKPQQKIEPWLSFGGGYANFSEGALRDGSRNLNSGINRGTFQFGGGIDFHTPLSVPILRIPLGARVEVRDYYSGLPNYQAPIAGSLQHNVIFAAGLVLKR